MNFRAYAYAAVLCLVTHSALAATLHGRVKDQQCSVLSKASVHIRATPSSGALLERTINTDDSGNYIIDLPAGEYQLCIQRGVNVAVNCSSIVMPTSGDKYITTQLREATPDLPNLGNHAY